MKTEKGKITLNWKTDIFSGATIISEDNKEIASLKSALFSETTELTIQESNYEFVKKGFFSNDFLINSISENRKIGEIQYDSFRTQAKIQLDGKEFIWKQKSFWNSRWILSDTSGLISTYSSKFSGGQIESFNDDYLLILTGLFTTNYYLRMIIFIMFIVLIPIIFRN